MDVCVSPSSLQGNISAIPSKSDAHRLLICSALSTRPTRLYLPTSSEDIDATCRCLSALGAEILRTGNYITVTPIQEIPSSPVLDCGESGSTLRFMLPVAAAICPSATFTGKGRLPNRPLGELTNVLKDHGICFSAPSLPFTISGQLKSGIYQISGNVSSQYITGLLLALSALKGSSEIQLLTELESAAYIDITLHALARFGIKISKTENGWSIPENKEFAPPADLAVEGDWSNAAFFLAAGALGHGVTLSGLDLNSPQGDKAILSVLKDFGAEVKFDGDKITVKAQALHGCTVDMRPIPDLLPILSVVAACSEGKTYFVNAARLRLKESDRLETTASMLKNLGISVIEKEDALIVEGGKLKGGIVNGANDHRIVMSAAIAATLAQDLVTITDSQAVNKSYPSFFNTLKELGGIAHGI